MNADETAGIKLDVSEDGYVTILNKESGQDGVKLKVENFSGYSKHSILQDFYAALFVSNIQSMLVEEINQEFDKLVLTKADKISFLKKIEGFAVSNVSNSSEKNRIDSGDLFKYTNK
jgi:hypothetical protein